MNPIWGHLVGVSTVILMALFVGIWIWLWRKQHKKVFDRMARIPMEDELSSQGTKSGEGEEDKHHE